MGASVLLLGHHSDDHTESMLLRLIRGSRGRGLNPIRSIARIPECYGIRGVGSSSWIENIPSNTHESYVHGVHNGKSPPRLDSWVGSLFAEPGINIMRPLLSFRKAQLLEFCQNQSIAWQEDESNLDMSLTARNTIRGILQIERLPEALRGPSLLRVAKKVDARQAEIRKTALIIFHRCEIERLDIRSGSLMIRIPTFALSRLPGKTRTVDFLRQAAIYVLRLLVQAVCPLQSVASDTFELSTTSFFPELTIQSPEETSQLRQVHDKYLTTRGVMFERVSPHESVWMLSRQPYEKPPIPFIVPPSVNPLLPKSEGVVQSAETNWSPWQFYDGRFWIRISNATAHPLQLRSLLESDLTYLKETLPELSWKGLHQELRTAAPGKIRWSLPVIALLHDPGVPRTEKKRKDYKGRHKAKKRQAQEEAAAKEESSAQSFSMLDPGPSSAPSFQSTRSESTRSNDPSSNLGTIIAFPTLHSSMNAISLQTGRSRHDKNAAESPIAGQWNIQWEVQYKDLGPEWLGRAEREGFITSWRGQTILRGQQLMSPEEREEKKTREARNEGRRRRIKVQAARRRKMKEEGVERVFRGPQFGYDAWAKIPGKQFQQ